MTATFGGSTDNQVYVYLNLVMSVIAACASLTIIFLVHRMNSNTGHVTLIYWMTWFQLAYDVTFFFSNVDCGYYVSAVANFFQLSCGITASLISNWIAFGAFYIITYRTNFDIMVNLPVIMLSSMVPGLVDGVGYFVAMVPKSQQKDDLGDIMVLYVYYYIRVFSIFLNFVFCAITIYHIRLISSQNVNKKRARNSRISSGSSKSQGQGSSDGPWYSWQNIIQQFSWKSTNKHMSVQEVAIRTLTFRMIYYPIVQAISRSGYSWYEAVYGTDIDHIGSNPSRYGALIFLTIITPMASVGYLLIFLAMQPRAYRTLVNMLHCRVDEETNRSTKFRSTANRPMSMISNERSAKSGSWKKSTLNLRPSFFDWNWSENTSYMNSEQPEQMELQNNMQFNPSIISTTSTITTSSENVEKFAPSMSSLNSGKDLDKFNDDELCNIITKNKHEGPANKTRRRSSVFGNLFSWKQQQPAAAPSTSDRYVDDDSRPSEPVPIDRDQNYSTCIDDDLMLQSNLSIFSTSSSTFNNSFIGNHDEEVGDLQHLSMSIESNDVVNALHAQDQGLGRSQPIPILHQHQHPHQHGASRSSASLNVQSSSTSVGVVSPVLGDAHIAGSAVSVTSTLNLSEDDDQL